MSVNTGANDTTSSVIALTITPLIFKVSARASRIPI